VTILANEQAVSDKIKDLVDVVPIEGFYDPKTFAALTRKISFDHAFRDGFWLKTIERLFVLAQFAEKKGLNSFLHAELDQLLFRVDELVDRILDSELRGLFFPFHTDNKGIASVFFCNDVSALESLLELVRTGDAFESEMELLAQWAALNPSLFQELPTIRNLVEGSSASVIDIDGIVDAAQVGQWVGGVDPRNTPLRQAPVTKFVDSVEPSLIGRDTLEKIRFSLGSEGALYALLEGISEVKIYNLHIHSKIHGYLLRSDPFFSALLKSANSDHGMHIPGARLIQIRYYWSSRVSRLIRDPRSALRFVFQRLRGYREN